MMTVFATALSCLAFITTVNAAPTRIKDIVYIEGVRDNVLVGYGLVVGLNGTGDSLSNAPMTRQSLTAMLERLGVSIKGENIILMNNVRCLRNDSPLRSGQKVMQTLIKPMK